MSDFYPRGQGFGFATVLPPAAPTNLRVTGATSNTISLAWDIVPGALDYGIFTCAGTPVATAGGPVGSATVTGLLPDIIYCFIVKALNGSGYGQPSNSVEVELELQPVYSGFVATTTPNAGAIQALPSSLAIVFGGTFVLTQSGMSGNYPCFAAPASFGVPLSIVFNTFNMGLQMSTVTIGGVLYNVFLSPYATFAQSLTYQVTPA